MEHLYYKRYPTGWARKNPACHTLSLLVYEVPITYFHVPKNLWAAKLPNQKSVKLGTLAQPHRPLSLRRNVGN